MIGSQMGRVATAEKMSVGQLQESLQNKTLPAYIAIPLIEEKLNMESRMRAMQALQKSQARGPQTPIAEQVMRRAQSEGGIDELPTQLSETGMAGGGIVAFGAGGMATSPEAWKAGYLRMSAQGIPAADIHKTYPWNPAWGRLPAEMEVPPVNPEARGNLLRQGVSEEGIRSRYPVGETKTPAVTGWGWLPGMSGVIPEQAQPPTPPAAAPAPAAPPTLAAPQKTPTAPPTAAAPAQRPQEGFGLGMGDYAKRIAEQEASLQAAIARNTLPGTAFGDYENMLRKEREEVAADRESAKGMALFKAGLAMMSGTSPRALENIGKGAMVGAEDYQAARKEARAAERDNTKAMALIEQARRAEAKGDMDRANKLLERASDKVQRAYEFQMMAGLQAQQIGAQGAHYAAMLEAAKGKGGVSQNALVTLRARLAKDLPFEDYLRDYATQNKLNAEEIMQRPGLLQRVKEQYETALTAKVARHVSEISGQFGGGGFGGSGDSFSGWSIGE